MTRPSPLENVTSGRPRTSDYQSLTPRTPHSRSGRAEEGYTEAELEDVELEELEQYRQQSQQSVPLLVSDGSFPPSGWRNRGDDHNEARKFKGLTWSLILSRLPLVVGFVVAMFLLALIWVAVQDPNENLLANGISQAGNARIISYENYSSFPLRGVEYRAECQKLYGGFMPSGDYWSPSIDGVLDVPHVPGDIYDGSEERLVKICSSTITYQLDGTVGLLGDLALMAQAAALARERNRTFLVDDTYWNRGKWINYFQDVRSTQIGPEPGCKAPPPNELVACPRLARHWVINARTAKFHFGSGFSDHYEDAYAHNLNRLKPIFEFSRVSLSETIVPNAEMVALIHRARARMSIAMGSAAKDRVSSPETGGDQHAPTYIGIHVRRGDQHASSWEYHTGFIPIVNFAQAAFSAWSRLLPSVPYPMTVYIASDSPLAQHDLVKLFPPETQILSLSLSGDPELKALESPKEYVQSEFARLDEVSRRRATKGMIVDFAMLNGMWGKGEVVPEATVCTIRSSVCRLSAVGLGWDRAFGDVDSMGYVDEQKARWLEIDQAGRVVPVWEAFQLFP